MSAYENDRQAGRQLAWLLAVVTVPAIGGAIWLGRTEGVEAWLVAAPAILLVATALAFWRPVVAIRLIGGRLDELWDLAEPSSNLTASQGQEVRSALTSYQEGNPVEVVVAERVVKDPGARKRLGKVLMLGGLVLLVPTFVFLRHLPEQAPTLPIGVFVAGLVLWYRTL